MRKLFLLGLLLQFQTAFAGVEMKPVVITQGELAEKGIKVRKTPEESPLPAWRIEVEIDTKLENGTYKSCELVILDRPVYSETLREIEHYLRDKAVRTESSKETKMSFTIFAKEAGRAYVAIVVRTGVDRYCRYLLAASELMEEIDGANHLPEATPGQRPPTAPSSPSGAPHL